MAKPSGGQSSRRVTTPSPSLTMSEDSPPVTGVLLDSASLNRDDLDFFPLHALPVQWTIHSHTAPDTLDQHLEDATIVLCNKVIITAETLAKHPHIRLICVLATGMNNIDLDACAVRGVMVKNVQGYGTDSVAQHVFGLLLQLARQFPAYACAVADGRWSHSPDFCLLDFPIVDLTQRTLGIVGYGELGKAVAKLAKAFGMHVVISERPGRTRTRPGRTSFDETLKSVDILSLHCPLDDSNQHLINAATLAAMKPGAWLVNTARGGLVDEKALAHALDNGVIAAAALDVLSQEPPPLDHPLLSPERSNLVITPHIAWAARKARQTIIGLTAENVAQYLRES